MMQQDTDRSQSIVTGPMVPALYRVERYTRETADTFTIGLGPASGDLINGRYHCAPGQFNMLYVFGMGEVPVSVSAVPAEAGLLTHTTRAVGAITSAMSALKVGDMVGVRGPFGSCWPMEKAAGKDVVLVAGGIGLAPLRPVIHALIANRNHFGKVAILYGARSPHEIIFGSELKKWKRAPGVNLYVTVDRGARSWPGSVGVVTRLIPQITFDPSNAIAMICGPEIMMHFTIDAFKKKGMAESDIYISMERNMKCAIGFCGHCQFGPHFICKDGPVFPYDRVSSLFRKQEI